MNEKTKQNKTNTIVNRWVKWSKDEVQCEGISRGHKFSWSVRSEAQGIHF